MHPNMYIYNQIKYFKYLILFTWNDLKLSMIRFDLIWKKIMIYLQPCCMIFWQREILRHCISRPRMYITHEILRHHEILRQLESLQEYSHNSRLQLVPVQCMNSKIWVGINDVMSTRPILFVLWKVQSEWALKSAGRHMPTQNTPICSYACCNLFQS